MHCHVCNVAVGDGQRFCHACGESLAGVTDPTEPIDAVESTDGSDDPASSDDGAVAAGAGSASLLASETVDPPPVAETMPTSEHRGALPDAAGAPASDDAWWDGSTEKPDPASMPQPPTQPLEPVAASGVPPASGLDSIPDDPERFGAVAAGGDAFAATSTMPVTAPSSGASSPGDVATDEFPHPDHRPQHDAAHAHTTAMASPVFDGGTEAEYVDHPEASQGFRLRASLVFSVLAVVAVLMASVADVIDIRTSRPVDGISVGFQTIDDIGTNLAVAGFVGAALMFLGSLVSCFGVRWGAGLAGGAGLSLVGWAALVLGRFEVPIHVAQRITRSAGADVNPFLLSITRDLGWFLIAAVAGLGVIVFFVSLRMAGTGGRRGLNPWIAAVGALAMVIAAAGPLIPLGGAALDVNLGTGNLPREFFAGRLIQVALLAVTGVIGFLSVRTYGLGFAAGGIGLAVWLWATSLIELGDRPVSLAVGNIGTLETTPHAVTTVGIAASLVLLVVAAVTSFVTRRRA